MSLSRLTWLLALGALGAGAPPAASAIGVEVRFASTPDGAALCKRIGRKEECYGVTPLVLSIEFNDRNESRRFELHKLGYRSAEVLVSPSTGPVTARLTRQELFPDPKVHKKTSLRELQQAVNVRVARAIEGYRGPADRKLRAAGKFAAIETRDGGTRLKFGVLINSAEVLRDLKKASRIRQEAKRYNAVMKAMREHGIFAFHDLVVTAVGPGLFDAIEFDVIYSRTQSVLDFEQVQELNQRWTGSYYTGYGDVVQRVDTYEVYTTTRDVTTVKDRKLSVEYTFISDAQTQRASARGGLQDHLDRVTIFTNDTRKGQVTRVELESRQ